MKKTLSLILALVLCLSLCACGGDNGVKLTLENYESYLKVIGYVTENRDGQISHGHPGIWMGKYSGAYKLYESLFQTQLRGTITVENLAPNYSYEGVEITVKFVAMPNVLSKDADNNNPSVHVATYEFEGTFKLAIGGTVIDGQEVIFDIPSDMMAFIDSGYQQYGLKYTYEVIGVKGTAVVS